MAYIGALSLAEKILDWGRGRIPATDKVFLHDYMVKQNRHLQAIQYIHPGKPIEKMRRDNRYTNKPFIPSGVGGLKRPGVWCA